MIEINTIVCGDSEKVLQSIPINSVDLIVTDPPYGISFLNKDWDRAVPSVEIWKQCFHVLKPGAFMFVMSSPRFDVLVEMGKRLKQAGFEIGFTPIFWVYSTGFGKGINISKEVDDFFGEKRGIIEPTGNLHKGSGYSIQFTGTQNDDIPLTEQAKQLDGSYGGFSPKPACEVIIVCMKPLSENSYVEQALSNQKGITWLGSDGRIPFAKGEEIDAESWTALRISEAELRSSFGMNKKFVSENYEKGKLTFKSDGTGQNNFAQYIVDERGRFPANLLVENNVLGEFSRYFSLDAWWDEKVKSLPKSVQQTFPFLIVPKPSSGEKDKGLKGFKKETSNFATGSEIRGERENIHPTIKPLKIFSYLITIASRPNDIVLDPFVGSGTAVIAAKILDRNYIGIDISEEYCKIAEARLKAYKKQKKLGDDL